MAKLVELLAQTFVELDNMEAVVLDRDSIEVILTSIPDVESNWSTVRVKDQWMHFHTKCGYVALLEFASHVTFDEGCFTSTTITDKNAFEGWNFLFCSHIVSSSSKELAAKEKQSQTVSYYDFYPANLHELLCANLKIGRTRRPWLFDRNHDEQKLMSLLMTQLYKRQLHQVTA